LRSLRKNKKGVLYVYAVILITLFVMGFFWFAFYSAISITHASIMASMAQWDNNSTYNTLELADTFLTNLWSLFLVLVCIILAYWVFHYSQQRGQVMME